MKKVRSRAPLRIGLAGGGTDVSPYCDEYGGAVLNVTISRYAYSTIELRDDNKVEFVANDLNETDKLPAQAVYPVDEGLKLHRAIYNRIIKDFNNGQPLALTLTTAVDCPQGSGLGASSTLMVAMVEAFRVLLNLPLGEYDVAQLAFDIERVDAGMAGGSQDQYAATFGGVNFIEFASRNRVIVNPLPLKEKTLLELESSILLYFTGVSRFSGKIIESQIKATKNKQGSQLEALHQIKREALEMKASLIRSELNSIDDIFHRGWAAKKKTSSDMSSKYIDTIYETAIKHGAKAGKLSGAGGGGFMMFKVDVVDRASLLAALEKFGGRVYGTGGFSKVGARGWIVE